MTCGGCVAKVKSELLKLSGVSSAEVSLEAQQATIVMDKHIALGTLQQAIGKYQITDIGTTITPAEKSSNSYYPIFLIFGYITGITLLAQYSIGTFDLMNWMSSFMAGFFLLFSFFKLLNLDGFAEGYSTYDVVAKKVRAWGYIYPFVELLLGVAYLTHFQPLATNVATLIVMGISSIGVAQSLIRKTDFQCACLGTIIKLPLSKVTLVEDLLMVFMSAIMVFNILLK